MATIKVDTGTIYLRVTPGGQRRLERFGDSPAHNVALNTGVSLTESSNPTDWAALLNNRVAKL